MTVDELFETLDLDSDGAISRSELHRAARRERWHWPHARLYALLDLLTIPGPLPRSAFISHMTRILRDPLGPFGEVLESSASSSPSLLSRASRASRPRAGAREGADRSRSVGDAFGAVVSLLEDVIGSERANDYEALVRDSCEARVELSAADSALLIIDPQRSFTCGAWMQSVGAGAETEVAPIRLAFDHCARLLTALDRRVETMFTRCPFPPDSYAWDERLGEVIEDSQLYFLKPGNSVLWPPTNGFSKWVDHLIQRGKKALVMGGCTLNSCLRVSALETQRSFADRGLRVAVDLSLAGARTRNYVPSELFGGMSAVESAVREMVAGGVRVVPQVTWE
ncbi:MAG: isochorismatase family protein [Deltaproteobacteria bacterium]|nr:isochorismatase family protein [Deltaproteobacteria bacterium]